MRENSERRIGRIEKMAEPRARVYAAIEKGITYTVLANDLGGTNGRRLVEAAQEALARDITMTDEQDLKKIAEDAIESELKAIGYDTAKVLADFYVTVDTELQGSAQ